jgi:dTMP kinase
MARKLPKSIPGGLFISLEGGEGSGKSTLMSRIEEFLDRRGYAVRVTREPGGPPISEAIREILLDPANRSMDSLTELFLYLASRRQNLIEWIRPHLDAGGVVISDRFADASVAYQGGGRELGLERVAALNREAIGENLPHLTFFLDLEPEAGLARGPGIRPGSEGSGDRIEREAMAFHRRVRESYRVWAAQHPERIRVLDASRGPDEVADEAIAAVLDLLRAKRVEG